MRRLSVATMKDAQNQLVSGNFVASRTVPAVRLTCRWHEAHSQTTRVRSGGRGTAFERLGTRLRISQPER